MPLRRNAPTPVSARSLVVRLVILGMVLLLTPTVSSSSAIPDEEWRENDITNGSLDMRLPDRVKIPPFFISVGPTLQELNDEEADAIRNIAENVLDDSFRAQKSHHGWTTFQSLYLLGVTSKKWLPSSRLRRTLQASPLSVPFHSGGGRRELADAQSSPQTVLEISGGVAEFLLPVNAVSPTEEQVTEIVKDSLQHSLVAGLRSASLNRAATHDFSYVTKATYHEDVPRTTTSVPEDEYLPSRAEIVLGERGGGEDSMPIILGVVLGAVMVAFVAALLVRKKRTHDSSRYGENDDDTGDTGAAVTGEPKTELHLDSAKANIGQTSSLDEYFASRARKITPPKKSKHRESPFGTPLTTASSIYNIDEDSISTAAADPSAINVSPKRSNPTSEKSEESFELQRTNSSLPLKKDMLFSNLNDNDDCASQNLSLSRFGAVDPSDGRTALKSTDVSASYFKSPHLVTNGTSFEVDVSWDPNDNDADSVPSIDNPFITTTISSESTSEIL